jgi:hypothetical protein
MGHFAFSHNTYLAFNVLPYTILFSSRFLNPMPYALRLRPYARLYFNISLEMTSRMIWLVPS